MALQLISQSSIPLSTVLVSRGTGCELGGALLGHQDGWGCPDWPEQSIAIPLLDSAASVREIWCCSGPVSGISGVSERIVWRRANGVIYGVIELDEAEFPDSPDCSSLQAASEEAYRRIFRLLDAQGVPNLWRAWNYLSRINVETHGLERYRQFNVGRQDAFIACNRCATGNVPAACAIGLADGPLSIAFLAGESPARAVENPRQVSAYRYPAEYGPRSPTFSRATLVAFPGQEILFVSGTASIVGHRTLHAGDAAAQCREALANVQAVVYECNRFDSSAPFALEQLSYRAYLRRAQDFPAVQRVLATLGPDVAVVYMQADICRTDLLVEIEAVTSHTLGI